MPARWHQQLVEKITGTDPDVPESAMRAHMRYGIEEIQTAMAR